MVCLWLTRFPPYPPLRGGDYDYSRELIESLSAACPVEAIAFAGGQARPSADGRSSWTSVPLPSTTSIGAVASKLPRVAYRHQSAGFLHAAVAVARRSEAVFVDFIGMAWLVKPLQIILKDEAARPPVVYIGHNYEYPIRRSMVSGTANPLMKAALAVDAWKAGRLETEALRGADGATAITSSDASAYRKIGVQRVEVIHPIYAGSRLREREINPAVPRRACILGNFLAKHRRMVVLQALEQIEAAGVPAICTIDVVGAGDLSDLKARFPHVNFLGFVEDIDRYLAEVRLGLIPDQIGGGFKIRALMHAFRRVPMLAVRHALDGMNLVAGQDYVEAESLRDLAASVPGLIEDFPTLNALQRSAYASSERAQDEVDRGQALLRFARNLRQT